MQPNTVTLPVDVANNGTIVQQTYSRYEEDKNRTVYVEGSHNPDNRVMLAIYRTFPTKSGNFKGVMKTAVKFTTDHQVPGVEQTSILTSPIIFELSASIPVGIDPADVVQARQRLIALLDNDTFMDALQIQLMV